jgi:sn-glycerol 3-phosphate transport system permease protein
MSVDVAALPEPRRRRSGGQIAKTILRYLALTVVALIVLFPLYITVVNSLLPSSKIAARPPTFFPTDPQWNAYTRAWDLGRFGPAILTSIIVTSVVVAAQVLTSILAGYAFAFLEFPLKRTIFVLFLATMMIPFEVIFLANLDIIRSLGLYNSYAGLAIPFLATGFGAFLLRQSFLTVPSDLRDAARLDGFGHFRFMFRVAVPLIRPAIAALAVFSFLGAWSEYLWPLIAAETDGDYRTVQIALRQLRFINLADINATFAGAVIATLPLLVLLIFFQKQLVRGLTAGAVKG